MADAGGGNDGRCLTMSNDALAERWWAFSQEYRKCGHWLRAQAHLADGDRRVLLLGPGKRTELHSVTLSLKAFLERAGFQAHMLDSRFEPDEHRNQAAGYPQIIALPITIGSCSEVLDFAERAELRSVLRIVLPREHSDGYFARILTHDRYIKPRSCGQIGADGNTDGDVGTSCLMALAAGIVGTRNIDRADSITASRHDPESVPARIAAASTNHPGSLPAGAGRTESQPSIEWAATVGIALIAAVCIAAATVTGLAAKSVFLGLGAFLAVVIVFIALCLVVLRVTGKISEWSVFRLMTTLLEQIPIIGRLVPPAPPDLTAEVVKVLEVAQGEEN